MEPADDRVARRRREIDQELSASSSRAAVPSSGEAASSSREAAPSSGEAAPSSRAAVPSFGEAAPSPVVARPRRERGFARSLVFTVGLLLIAAVLFGLAATLGRLSGNDMADASRQGQASVRSCAERGPITNRGFGFWHSCDVSITWAGGTVERLTMGAVFTPADIGREVTVGDLGTHRTRRQLARADVAARPYLEWLGYGVGAIALVPTFIGVMLLSGLFRSRKR